MGKEYRKIEYELTYELTHCPDALKRFFNYVSNIRPIIWICMYLTAMPLFALFYYLIPLDSWRIPDGGGTSYWSWLYYSIVTITTLGFGDYTPAHGWAQVVTAVEVVFGLSIFGFFLNAVGAMRSAIDVASAMDRERQKHEDLERDKLLKNIPMLLHRLNRFLAYCYAVTTPRDRRSAGDVSYNPDFTFHDMRDMYLPGGLPFDTSGNDAVDMLLRSARETTILLDTIQNRIDLSIWPALLEDSFSFVANTQLLNPEDSILLHPDRIIGCKDTVACAQAKQEIAQKIEAWTGPAQATDGNPLNPVVELYLYIKSNADIARRIETEVTRIASDNGGEQ